MVPGCNMPAMTGGTVCSVVVPGLLVGLCLCEPLHAGQDSQREEPQQSRTTGQDLETLRRAAEQGDTDAQATLGTIFPEGIILPQFDGESVWLRPTTEQGGPGAQVSLASAPLDLGRLFDDFDIHAGPVPHGAPTHRDMIAITTPLEFSTPAAISFDVIGWTWRDR